MKTRTLRFQICASIALIFIVISLIAGIILFFFENQRQDTLMQKIEISVRSIANQYQESIANELFMKHKKAVKLIVTRIMKIKGVVGVAVYDAKGKIFHGTSDWLPDAIDPLFLHKKNKEHSTRVVLHNHIKAMEYLGPIIVIGDKLGFLVIDYSLSDLVMEARLTFLFFFVLLVTVMLSIAILLYFFLGRLVIKPVSMLARTMSKIKEGSLGARVDFDSPNEIGEMAAIFNQMSESNKKIYKDLDRLNKTLEQKVDERTIELNRKNMELESYMERLKQEMDERKKAMNQLVQSEKMAALGGLVAGVAHEINTPIGVSLTAASHLQDKTLEAGKGYKKGLMKQSDFEKYMTTATKASEMILYNLDKAASLIKSFKKVSMDQSSEKKRLFNLRDYIKEALLSLEPEYKRSGHQVVLSCPEDIEIESYPGVFWQIVTNLVMNSISHGFAKIENGKISIDIRLEREKLLFSFEDNGIGMDRETTEKCFDPFFTTARGKGGTGLGLHIVYNLVVQTLGGEIQLHTEPGQGVRFIIKINPILMP